MQASELKIGNYIYLKSKNRIYEISTGYEIDIGTDSEDFEPIPLTEEILLKCGFEKDDIRDQDYYEWYQKEFPIIGVLCQSSDKTYLFDENTDTLRIYYLHQLQNLTFALTGQELSINL